MLVYIYIYAGTACTAGNPLTYRWRLLADTIPLHTLHLDKPKLTSVSQLHTRSGPTLVDWTQPHPPIPPELDPDLAKFYGWAWTRQVTFQKTYFPAIFF